MNRINRMIDMYATIETDCFNRAILLGRGGFFEESADMTHRMLEARENLKMWLKISKAIRGWQL